MEINIILKQGKYNKKLNDEVKRKDKSKNIDNTVNNYIATDTESLTLKMIT